MTVPSVAELVPRPTETLRWVRWAGHVPAPGVYVVAYDCGGARCPIRTHLAVVRVIGHGWGRSWADEHGRALPHRAGDAGALQWFAELAGPPPLEAPCPTP